MSHSTVTMFIKSVNGIENILKHYDLK